MSPKQQFFDPPTKKNHGPSPKKFQPPEKIILKNCCSFAYFFKPPQKSIARTAKSCTEYISSVVKVFKLFLLLYVTITTVTTANVTTVTITNDKILSFF